MLHSKKIPPEIQSLLVQAIISVAFIAVFAYFNLWIAFGIWSDISHQLPTFFRVNACVFVFEAFTAYQFMQYCKESTYEKLDKKQYGVTVSVLLSGLHWSIITTYLMYSGFLDTEQLFTLRLISVGIIGILSTLLSIASHAGMIFAAMVLMPHLVASYWFHDPNAHFLSLLSFYYLFFIYISTLSIKRNYFLQFISKYRLTQVHTESMEHLSKKDIITKLNNRFHWSVSFESMWKTSHQKHEPISLIGIKVHHLAEINAAHGYQTGDAIMTAVASLLQQYVEEPDLLGRYAGDQFMLTMPGKEYDQAQLFANQLVQGIQEKLHIPDGLCRPVYLSTSVACSTQETAQSAQTMVSLVSQQLMQT